MSKHAYITLLFCSFAFFNSAQAQVVPESYRQQKQQEMSHFADSIYHEFVRYLEHLWTEYQIFEGELSPRNIKPVEQPRFDILEEADTLKIDNPIQYGQLIDVQAVQPETSSVPNVEGTSAYRYKVQFYGRELSIAMPENIASVRLGGIQERKVARFWKQLVECHADQCVASLDLQRRNLYLNDWGLFDLTRHFAATVYPGQPDEQSVFSTFLMDALHYDVRVGRMDDRLVILVNTGSRLYDIPYVEIDAVRYYAFGNIGQTGRLHTYDRQMNGADRPIGMHLAYSPRLGMALSDRTYQFALSEHTVEICVSRPLIDFYAQYPQTELSVYANAAMEESLSTTLERELSPLVKGHGTVEALNALLKFLQEGFTYQTDRSQFGREKNFFCEENFHYPANDCEDRAILFAHMVKILLGYDVVLLEYPDHVATAVALSGEKVRGYHLDIQGKRYMVCDPTCMGAATGDLGRRYRNKKANVIIINT